ncbi:MAG TPA: hypothetical protein VKR22_01535 [Acidimicrobiales bacterium]|nr:hypothetical protein [Acidimicrobiales bacterium]
MEDAPHPETSPSLTGKVKVGFFSFTEITDPAAHHAYNEWHQLDHLPEQYPIPGIAWGQRWVSTPECRRARAVDGEQLAPIHYVTLYLMSEPVAETLGDFAALGRHLHEVGRFHEERRSLLSGPFTAIDAVASPRVLVSAAALPFRPCTGVYVMVEALGEGRDASGLWRHGDAGPLLEVPGVAGVWSFAADGPPPGTHWRPGRHRVTVCYLDGDPLEAAGSLGPLLAGPERPDTGLEPILAGPFETITPWRWDWFD